jgi:hypothetical protein
VLVADRAKPSAGRSFDERLSDGFGIVVEDVKAANWHIHQVLYGFIKSMMEDLGGPLGETNAPVPDIIGLPPWIDIRRLNEPELLAEAPNQVWSWDITKLMGPAKWPYFYLYVILDIFSRRVVGWCVADAESTVLFKELFDDAFVKQGVLPGQLTLHADRGGPMKAKPARTSPITTGPAKIAATARRYLASRLGEGQRPQATSLA